MSVTLCVYVYVYVYVHVLLCLQGLRRRTTFRGRPVHFLADQVLVSAALVPQPHLRKNVRRRAHHLIREQLRLRAEVEADKPKVAALMRRGLQLWADLDAKWGK